MRKSKNDILVAYPILKLLIPYVCGILLAHFFDFSLFSFPILWTILLLFLGFSFVSARLNKRGLTFIFISLIFVFFGFLRTESISTSRQNESEKLSQIGLLSDSLQLFGTVKSVKESPKAFTYLVKTDSILFNQIRVYSEQTLVQLIFYRDNSSSSQNHQIQDKIGSVVSYKPISDIKNPNQFNYGAYLTKKGILAQFQEIQFISSQKQSGLHQLKQRFEEAIERLFKLEEVGIAKALIIGDKSDINPETRLDFSRSGLSHLMAVSGLHVGFLVAPFWFIIPWIWTKKFGRLAGILFLGFALLSYCWLTGFSASVVRASIMAFLFTYAKLYEKVRYPLNIVGFAAFVLLLYDPGYLSDVGFQLSFGAVSLILVLMPLFDSITREPTRLNKILASILVGLVVQIGLFPLLAVYFGEISVISPITNLFAMLPASLLVQFGLLSTIITIFIPSVAPYLGFVLNWLAKFLGYLAHFFSSTDFSYAEFSSPHPLFIVFWITFIIALAVSRNKQLRWNWVLISLSALIFWRVSLVFTLFERPTLKLTVFDIGQGDANLLETPNKKRLLIDTGIWSPNYDSGSRVLVPELRAKGIKHIDGIVLSHPHADHIGGTLPILQAFSVGALYTDTSSAEPRSNLFQRILTLAYKKKIPVIELHAGDQILLDPSISIKVLWPVKSFSSSNLNEISTVLRVDFDSTSFLFTGDAEENAEELMSSTLDEVLDTDYLKVGHHGSRSSSHTPFLEDVTPKFASVSLGNKNKYKHPHAQSMLRMQVFNPKIHFTNLSGAAIYESDGKHIWEVNWRKK